MRIAWFSPLNLGSTPTPSIAAYSSDELLPLLQQRFEIELFHDSFDAYKGIPAHHYLSAFARHRERPFDLFFYQLEDCRASVFSRFHLALLPGMVLYHDFLLSDFGPEPLLNSPWENMVHKFNQPEMAWPSRSIEYVRNGPHAHREAGFSLISLFSSERSHIEYRQNALLRLKLPTCELQNPERIPSSYYLPYPVNPIGLIERKPSSENVIAFCGSPWIQHRSHQVLAALGMITSPYKFVWLVEDSEQVKARELLAEFKIEGFELVTGRSPARWREIAVRSDVAVHSLFSVFGQPGPYLSISLMAGLPSLVTNFGSPEYLPDSVVYKIEAGEFERVQIAQTIEKILASEALRDNQTARAFAFEQFHVRSVASQLAQVFEITQPLVKQAMQRWEHLEIEARSSLITESPLYWGGGVSGDLKQDRTEWERELSPIFSELGWGI